MKGTERGFTFSVWPKAYLIEQVPAAFESIEFESAVFAEACFASKAACSIHQSCFLQRRMNCQNQVLLDL